MILRYVGQSAARCSKINHYISQLSKDTRMVYLITVVAGPPESWLWKLSDQCHVLGRHCICSVAHRQLPVSWLINVIVPQNYCRKKQCSVRLMAYSLSLWSYLPFAWFVLKYRLLWHSPHCIKYCTVLNLSSMPAGACTGTVIQLQKDNCLTRA